MKKRMFVLALCVCALVAAPMQTLALQLPEEVVSPCYVLIETAKANLSISDGTAEITASVTGMVDSVDKAEIEAELQVKDGTRWRYCGDWSVSKNSYRASLSESRDVVAGNTYRVKAVVTVWSGSQSETQTIYSSQRTA